jgi:UPF0271 protein
MPVNSGWKNTFMRVSINCDMGEGIGNDEVIIPFIDVANIACGFHAGDEDTMRRTIEACKKYNVAVGAHVSFLDRANFGRTEMSIPANALLQLITTQLSLFDRVAKELGLKPFHVKPHGALYNIAARNRNVAKTIAMAVKDFDASLILFGLSNSHSIHEAKELGLGTRSEVFADRTYQDDGSLTPRSQPGALIDDVKVVAQHVLQMVHEGTVTTTSGNKIPILAETICVHGDGENAAMFVETIKRRLGG